MVWHNTRMLPAPDVAHPQCTPVFVIIRDAMRSQKHPTVCNAIHAKVQNSRRWWSIHCPTRRIIESTSKQHSRHTSDPAGGAADSIICQHLVLLPSKVCHSSAASILISCRAAPPTQLRFNSHGGFWGDHFWTFE